MKKKIDKAENKIENFFKYKDVSINEKFKVFISRLLSISKATMINENKYKVFFKADKSIKSSIIPSININNEVMKKL